MVPKILTTRLLDVFQALVGLIVIKVAVFFGGICGLLAVPQIFVSIKIENLTIAQ